MASRAFTFATVALCLAVGVAAVNPTFPSDWSSLTINAIAINQGGIPDGQGNICCPANAVQCKIQTAYSQGMQYFDVTNQRTAFKNPDGSGVVSLFKDGKEYQVDASGNCQAYCPLEQKTLLPLSLGENATDLGPVVYNGVKCEHFMWRVAVPILNITMEVSDFYATSAAGGTWVPIAEIDHIEPLGQQLGVQNQTFVNFTPGPQDSKHFVVNGAASCQMSNQCQGNDDGPSDDDGPSGRAGSRLTTFSSSLAYQSYSQYYARYN